jgi:DNA-nicking Smr family endonuclease
MRKKTPHALAPEDRILWEKVVRSITPLKPLYQPHGKRSLKQDRPAVEAMMAEDLTAESAWSDATASISPMVPAQKPVPDAPPSNVEATKKQAQPQPLDAATTRKIARGQLQIEARIDLHGMTQDEAHGLLLGFVERAAKRQVRTLLVITGKGKSLHSEGVLRRAVPLWLKQPAFARHISGYSDAALGHGGSGALYVRMRRRDHGST